MVVILDELTHEDQKLFGELYDDKGRRIVYCRWCGQWGIYLIRDNEGNISLMDIDDDSTHTCHNLEAIRGYYKRESS